MGDLAGQVANRIIELVDLDRMLEKVDLDAVIQRLDVDAVIQEVDVDAIVRRVDIDAIIDRVDVDRIVARVDVDAIIERVDVDRIVERIDVNRIVGETDLAKVVTSSTTGIFAELLYLIRRQMVGIDAIVAKVVDTAFRRKPGSTAPGPPHSVAEGQPGTLEGHTAGPVARLVAYLADAALAFTSFSLFVAAVRFILNLVFDLGGSGGDVTGPLWGLALLGWLFLYWWYPLATFGKTIGMALVGMEVVTTEGRPIGGKAAAVRTVVLPISLAILWLGVLPVLIARDRRALHDHAAHTAVVYDWPATVPRYLSAAQARAEEREQRERGEQVEGPGAAA